MKKQVSPEVRRIRVYVERNRVLKAMGFSSYDIYLKSDLWKSIRAQVLEAQPRCYGCGKPAKQVHHQKYTKKVLEGRTVLGLYAICGGCHYASEFRRRDGEKLNPAQATMKLKQRRTRNGLPPAITSAEGFHIGDWVQLVNGEQRKIMAIRQANYLPQFRVGNRWIGKTKILGHLPPLG